MRKSWMVVAAVLLMAAAFSRRGAMPGPSWGTSTATGSTSTASRPPERAQATPPDPAKPSESRVAIYQLSDLLAGREEPATTWRIPDPVNGFVLAPDGETALLFAGDPMIPGPAPLLRHLPSGKTTPLAGPPTDDWFPFGGWLPDGRLMLAGKQVWIGDGAGNELSAVADANLFRVIRPSPTGGQLALWHPGGQIGILSLGSGQHDTLSRPFRPPGDDGAVNVAWSPDGKLLAASDFPSRNGRQVSIRIIDAASRQQVREIAGLALIDWLADGNLLTVVPGAGRNGSVYRVVTPQGKTVREYEAMSLTAVPGGRYLLEMTITAEQTTAFLIDIGTGERKPIPLPDYPRGWTAAGDPIVITAPK